MKKFVKWPHLACSRSGPFMSLTGRACPSTRMLVTYAYSMAQNEMGHRPRNQTTRG